MYTIDEMRNPSQYRCSRCHSNFTKKEFDKIPPVRQEMIKKDKNYKIIEDEKH
jgi:hypothetical protein